MASLNTLRTKGGWIISIVIGLALLAFILPEVFSRTDNNPNKLKVGIIDGEKVSSPEYASTVDRYTSIMGTLYGRNNFNSQELDVIRNMAWEGLIMNKAYYPGFEKLGIAPLESEQADMVAGAYLSPVITSFFSNPQTGQFDRAQFANFVASTEYDPTGQSQTLWDYLKTQMNQDRAMSKYISLVAGGLYVTDMEVETVAQANSNAYSAKVISMSYSEVPDSAVNVTDADLRKYYEENKAMFRQSASRDIEYVVFDILPSDDDYTQAEKEVSEIASDFAASETPMQYAILNSQTRPDNRYYAREDLSADMADVIWDKPEAMYGPQLAGDVYTIARLGEVKMMPDSLGAKHILLAATETALADSLVGAIKSGSDFELLAARFSSDQSARTNFGDLGRFTPEQMVPEFSDAVMAHKVGDVFTVTSQFGLHIVEATYKSPAVKKAQLAVITYNVDPSSITDQVAFNQARTFQQAAYGSYDKFKKASAEEGLAKRVQRVMNTDREISGLEDSRQMTYWAFNARKGDVSEIEKVGDAYVVAVVTDAIEDGIAPLNQVMNFVRPEVTRLKKAEYMISKMEGNTIVDIAEAIQKEVLDVVALQFRSFVVPGIGADLNLIGAITSGVVPEGALSKPVVSETGVHRFMITNVRARGEADLTSERVALEAAAAMSLDQRLVTAMSREANIKDMRIKFGY